jgi:type III restriction enzyme
MAMLIAWQTVNAVRKPNSKKFTRGFLIVTPGLTIRDRLRVLQPNDPDSYYQSRERRGRHAGRPRAGEVHLGRR